MFGVLVSIEIDSGTNSFFLAKAEIFDCLISEA